MLVEWGLLLVLFGILLLGRIISDRIQDQQRWFCFYEQKKITFPYPKKIQAWEEIPGPYRSIFPRREKIPYTIHIPGCDSVLRKRSEKLIVLYDDKLTIFEGNTATGKDLPFDEILCVEHGKMLHAFRLIVICQHQTAVIPYFTRGDTCFDVILNSLRVRSCQIKKLVFTPEDSLEQRKLDGFAHVPHKFLRMARISLLPGQKIMGVFFQPSYTRKKTLYGNLITKAIIYAPHLSLLTDSELILIQEDKPVRTVTYNQYAMKRLFISYRNIQTVGIREEETTLQFTLYLNDTHSHSLFFARENAQAQTFLHSLPQMLERA